MIKRSLITIAGATLFTGGLVLGGIGWSAAQTLPDHGAGVSRHHAPGMTMQGSMHGRATEPGPVGHGAMSGQHAQVSGDIGRHFIQEMIPHHEDAVTMADLALTQAEHAELRELAETIKRVQMDEIALMRGWYEDWYGTEVPASHMGGAMPSTAGHDAEPLDGARPFDKTFIEQMIPHHEMALMMSRMALQAVGRPELRDLLESIIASQSADIDQMRSWYQAWYGEVLPSSSGHGSMGGMGTHPMAGMRRGMGADR